LLDGFVQDYLSLLADTGQVVFESVPTCDHVFTSWPSLGACEAQVARGAKSAGLMDRPKSVQNSKKPEWSFPVHVVQSCDDVLLGELRLAETGQMLFDPVHVGLEGRRQGGEGLAVEGGLPDEGVEVARVRLAHDLGEGRVDLLRGEGVRAGVVLDRVPDGIQAEDHGFVLGEVMTRSTTREAEPLLEMIRASPVRCAY